VKILVTGGCGYKGSVLVPKLQKAGHNVKVYDTQWFGKDERWAVQDIREMQELESFDAIIHLASVANDPSANLAPGLTWEVTAHGTQHLMDLAARAGVKHFIYASSASVYGVKEEERVTEDLTCVPVSVYNRSKLVAERICLSYADQMAVTILRPATVCGLSPRMRLDVVVNMLTMQALTRGKITVLGGTQTRPNIHIEDITNLYCWLLDRPEITGVFNAGNENLAVSEIAEIIAEKTGAKIDIKPSDDPRSYRLCSDKLATAGWGPQHTVNDAVAEITEAARSFELVEDDSMSNVNWMRREGIV